MRKKLALVLGMTWMLLTGCAASEPAQLPLTFRTELLQAGGCSFTAAVEADYGQTVTAFTLACACTADSAELTVLQPESLAGISASVRDTASYVTYDGVQIGLGSLADGTLAPLAAPYVLARCWSGEYIDTTGTEDGLLCVRYRMGYDAQELTVDTWFRQEPAVPVRAEVSSGGVLQLRIDISDFSVGAG